MYNYLSNLEENNLGKIQIAPQVVEVIAKHATIETEGVTTLSGNLEITDFLGMGKTSTKGVKVELGTKEVIVDISIVIKAGYNIPQLAEKIQENVKNAIETMTHLEVVEVNIHINGIEFSTEV